MWESLKSAVRWFLDRSIWYRLIISAILGALGGSTLVGFLNNYAVYFYAFWHGARVPVEGVPYLSLAASLVSFAMLMSSFLCATLIYGMFWFIASSLNKMFPKAHDDQSVQTDEENEEPAVPVSRRSTPSTWADWISFVSSILSSVIASLGFIGIKELFLRGGAVAASYWQVLVVFAVLSVVIVYLAFHPERTKWFAVCLTVLLVVSICVCLFIQPIYSRFLAEIRYGGGVDVTITTTDQTGKIQETTGALFLTTSESYILFVAQDSRFVEVGRPNVTMVSYSADGKRTVLP
jgi:hypothetical protein